MNKEHNHMTTHPPARRSRLIAASTAVALAAAGAVAIPLAASATSDSPYVTVAWSYPGYPDMSFPQPYIASAPGANLHAFDELAASGAWCGKPIQVDVYQRTDKHGVSWETLKETGALLNSHDGGFLAYNAGVGTPYRVITSEEYPCTTTTPTPTPTPGTPTPTPTPSAPGAPVTPTPSAPVTEPAEPVTTPPTSGHTPGDSAPRPTPTTTSVPKPPKPSGTPSTAPHKAPAATSPAELPATPIPVAVSGSVSFTG